MLAQFPIEFAVWQPVARNSATEFLIPPDQGLSEMRQGAAEQLWTGTLRFETLVAVSAGRGVETADGLTTSTSKKSVELKLTATKHSISICRNSTTHLHHRDVLGLGPVAHRPHSIPHGLAAAGV